MKLRPVKSSYQFLNFTLMLLVLLSVTPAWAANDPHQHGAGTLNVVIDGSDLALEVRLPANDVIGFEHSPENDKQTAAAHKALDSFKAGNLWFEPSPQAKCVVEQSTASIVGLSTDASHDHKEKHEHKNEHKKKHDHAHEEKHADEEEHADFEGTLQFHCDNPGKLAQLKVNLFSIYPGIEELEVQLVTATVQNKRRLSKQESVLKLSQ